MKTRACQSCLAGEIDDVPAVFRVVGESPYRYVCEGHAEILIEDGAITAGHLQRLEVPA